MYLVFTFSTYWKHLVRIYLEYCETSFYIDVKIVELYR